MFNKDSVFLRHEPCPKCGSRDNLSVWSDGHKYCFGCGYYVSGDGNPIEIIRRKNVLSQSIVKHAPKLPSDASMSFPQVALDWLEEAHIPVERAVAERIRWSEEEGGIIMPVYDEDNSLVMYQIRRFNTKPKYETRGVLGNHVPIFGNQYKNGIVVVVEDMLSAIRISDFADACPLFGSHFSRQLAVRLSKVYDRVLIWLDNDKKKEALKFYLDYKYLFIEAKYLVTVKDPKKYSDEQLMEEIFGSFDWEENDLTEFESMVQ